MPTVFLDFETRSSADLSKVGSYAYANHESTKVLCVTACLGDGEVKLFTEMQDFQRWLASIPEMFTDAMFVAHNAQFDMEIYNKFVFMTHPNEWYCTMAACRAYGIPASLEKAGAYVGLEMQKDMKLSRRIKRLFTQHVEDAELYQALYEYAKKDTLAMRELFHRVRQLTPTELDIWRLDSMINRRGIGVDRESAQGLQNLVDASHDRLAKRFESLSGGIKPTQVMALKQLLQSRGHAMPGLTKSDVVALLDGGTCDPDTEEMLRIRLQLGKASVKKIAAVLKATDPDDSRIRNLHVYHKAHTGRWAGRGAQPQNLPSRGLLLGPQEAVDGVEELSSLSYDAAAAKYGNVLDAVSSCLRPLFKAKKLFAVIDFAQIESRVLAWLAGESQILDAYESGKDLYVEMAKAIYGVEEVTKEQRSLGKAAILGLGYGMGHAKFQATAASMFGIKITEEFAQQVVRTYRNKYGLIREFWYTVDKSFFDSIDPEPGVFNRLHLPNGLRFWSLDHFGRRVVAIELPSSRKLFYHGAHWDAGEKKGWVDMSYHGERNGQVFKTKVYGGLLVENIVQAVSRDLLASSMLNLQSCGYEVVMHVHDEVVVEVESEDQYGHVESLVKQKPSWADGLPLEADGFITTRYMKG